MALQLSIKQIVLFVCLGVCHAGLGDFLHHYDTLHYRDIQHHHISKRSIKGHSHYLQERVMSFDTLGKHFELQLTTNRKLFSKNFHAYAVNNGRTEDIFLDQDEFYEGYLVDDTKSKVFAYLEGNNFVISIKTKKDTYIVEPSSGHLPYSDAYSMLSYKASDMKTDQEGDPEHHVSTRGFCGYVKEGVDRSNDTHLPVVEDVPDSGYTYTQDNPYQQRYRRQATTLQACPVALVADYHFTREVGGNSTQSTSKYLAGVLSTVNGIYETTDFGNGFENMGFEIKTILVYASPTVDPEFNKEQNYWDTEALLRSFGKVDWSDYCLAHLFTYLQFDGGVQGLGWIASSKTNQVGGVCSQVYQGTHYNAAWTSHKNAYGNRILALEANLVTAHEFGHNWGSPHDPAECAPSGFDGGKHVMYQYAVSGYDPNNNQFSSCSRSSIGSVLQVKNSWCFAERNPSVCGNMYVEEGEECDAGLSGLDDCCSTSCTLFKTAQCSDANSECCQSCSYAPSTKVCREASSITCEDTARCSGTDAVCPASSAKPDNSTCLDRGSCIGGVCTPLCEFKGMSSCTCDESATACYYCCKNTIGSCVQYASDNGPYELPDGRSCYAGFCYAGVCNETDTSNTARLWDIITSLDINAILEWMRNNIVITVIVLSLILYIPLCIGVWCIDRKRAQTDAKHVEWMDRDNDRLIMDESSVNVRRTHRRRRQPRNDDSNPTSADEASELSTSRVNYQPLHY